MSSIYVWFLFLLKFLLFLNHSSLDGSYLSILLYAYLAFVKLVMYTNLHMDHNNICGAWLNIEKWNQNLVVRIIYTTLLYLYFSKSFNSYLFVAIISEFGKWFSCLLLFSLQIFLLFNEFIFFSHYFLWMNIQMHFRVRSQLKEFFPWSCLAFPRNTSLSSNWFSYQGL